MNKNDEGLLDDEIEDSHRLIMQARGGRPRLCYKNLKGDCRRQWAERATLSKKRQWLSSCRLMPGDP